MGEGAVLKSVTQDVQRFARQIRKMFPFDRARQRGLDVKDFSNRILVRRLGIANRAENMVRLATTGHLVGAKRLQIQRDLNPEIDAAFPRIAEAMPPNMCSSSCSASQITMR
jgi:hypothetical protein